MTAMWLLGPAALAVVGAPAVRRFAPPVRAKVPRWVPDLLAVVALVILTAVVYAPLVAGHPPTTWDNNYGVLKTVETEDLLARHELFGWSDFEDAGFPANANYPVAGALLASALDALPGVSLQAAEAYCALWAMLSMVLACYLAGRLHFGRWVGLLAGTLALLDPGGWWVGGHFMAVEVGMWIQTVSAAFTVAGLALWPRAVSRGGAWVPLSGAAFGVAVLFHPQAVPLVAAAGVVMLLALLATPGLPTRQALTRTGVIALLALATSGWWLFQYVAHLGSSQLPPIDPPHAADVWSALAQGTVLHGPALWLGVCVVGVLILARRRDPWSVFVAVCVPALAIAFTCDALDLFHLRAPWTGGVLDRLQLSRMGYLQRPLAFVAVAYALGRASRHLAKRLARRPARAWGWVGRAGVAGLLLTVGMLPGFVVPGWPANPSPTGLSQPEAAAENQALDAALRLMQPGDHLVIRNTTWVNHDLIFQAALRGVKILNLGGDAAMMFKHHFFAATPRLIARVGGTVMLSRGALPPRLRRLALVQRIGDFDLHTVPRQPRAWMVGPGAVQVVSWADEAVKLRVSGATPQSRVVVGLGYYDAWRADDGSPLTPFAFDEATLTALPAHDGEVVLRFHHSAWPALGLAFGLLVWGALFGLAWRARTVARLVPMSPLLGA